MEPTGPVRNASIIQFVLSDAPDSLMVCWEHDDGVVLRSTHVIPLFEHGADPLYCGELAKRIVMRQVRDIVTCKENGF